VLHSGQNHLPSPKDPQFLVLCVRNVMLTFKLDSRRKTSVLGKAALYFTC